MSKILGVDEEALSDYERELYTRADEYKQLLTNQVRLQSAQIGRRLLKNVEISFAPAYSAGELPSRDAVAREIAAVAIRMLDPVDQRALIESTPERLQITS
jgi:hypothetical protein